MQMMTGDVAYNHPDSIKLANCDSGTVVIGKPVGGSVKPMTNSLPQLRWQTRQPSHEVNWKDFNYPPLLNLVHYDSAEVDRKLRTTVRCLNFSFLLTTLICWLNLFDSVMLVAVVGVPFKWIVQSSLHVVLFPTAALWTFYLGYRGLASSKPHFVQRFLTLQPALAALYFLLAVASSGSVNGLARLWGLADLVTSADDSMLLIWVIFSESALWLLNCFGAVINTVLVRRLNQYPEALPDIEAQKNPW